MPFVFVLLPKGMDATKEAVESACKDAWTSMNGKHGVTGLKSSDIAGVIDKEGEMAMSACHFLYVNRGEQFENNSTMYYLTSWGC